MPETLREESGGSTGAVPREREQLGTLTVRDDFEHLRIEVNTFARKHELRELQIGISLNSGMSLLRSQRSSICLDGLVRTLQSHETYGPLLVRFSKLRGVRKVSQEQIQ
jgi:hypothetical protein